MSNRSIILALGLVVLLAFPLVAEPPAGEFEVHELSLWITDGGGPVSNAKDSFSSPFPSTVTSSRPTRANAPAAPLGPLGLITFHGRPAASLDIELRIKNGSFIAHWPSGEVAGNRLLWSRASGTALVEQPEGDSSLMWVDAEHWIRKARTGDGLFVRSGTRSERFLAYDAERQQVSPLRLHGGPDKFTVSNQSDSTLFDLFLVQRTPAGVRVAWLDELPTGGPAAAPAIAAEKPAEKPAEQQPVDAKAPPEAAPPTEKPKVGLFGLAIPKSARTNAAVGGPAPTGGVEMVLSAPLPTGSAEAQERTTGELARRLGQLGLTAHEIDLFVSHYATTLFDDESLVVGCRQAPAALDADLTLSVFPVPTKVVRVPLLLARNVDPQLPDQINRLIAQLGDDSFAKREEAEKQLRQFGVRAFPHLQQAIQDSDLEVVVRAERILLNQGQKAAGRLGASEARKTAIPLPAKAAEVASPKS